MLTVLLRPKNSVFAALSAISTAVAIALYMLPQLKALFDSFTGIFEDSGIPGDYCKSIIKVIGIAYFTEIIAALCRDAGESAIGAKLELAGKVMALSITVPTVSQLMSVIKEALALI